MSDLPRVARAGKQAHLSYIGITVLTVTAEDDSHTQRRRYVPCTHSSTPWFRRTDFSNVETLDSIRNDEKVRTHGFVFEGYLIHM